jgi:hypothetical protein
MALVAVSVWDALSLDHRDTEILGPLPLRRGVIIRAKMWALVVFAAGFAAALNGVPAMMHPVASVSRLRPGLLQVYVRGIPRRYVRGILDAIALHVVARRPLVRAGLFFTMRVLARSVQNRLSIGIPLAVAIAVATVSLPAAGMTSTSDFANAPVAVLAVQLLFVTALVIGFRHSIRVPADLRARWLFHLIRPTDHRVYLRGAKRAAVLKLVLPAQLALLPFHVIALGRQTAIVHFAFGLLSALVLREAVLLEYRRLPFAASYVPQGTIATHAGLFVFACVTIV